MKLTPLDIHHKEFHRAIRGYNEEEVDKFLDEVAEEFERLFKENIELKEQAEKVRQELEGYSGMEKTLQSTLLTAQRSAEDVLVHSRKEAELIVRDAEVKAKEVIQEAYDLKGKYEATLSHLKDAEVEFRNKFKSMLESYMRIADSTAILADIGTNIVGLEAKPSPELEQLVDKGQEFSESVEIKMAEIDLPRLGMVPDTSHMDTDSNPMERPLERDMSSANDLASRLADDLSHSMGEDSMEIGLNLNTEPVASEPNHEPSGEPNHDFLSEYSGHSFTPEDLLSDSNSAPSISEYRGSIDFGNEPLRPEKKDEDEDDKPDKFDLDSLAF